MPGAGGGGRARHEGGGEGGDPEDCASGIPKYLREVASVAKFSPEVTGIRLAELFAGSE